MSETRVKKKLRKRKEAEIRNDAYNKLSIEEKMVRNSVRVHEKLKVKNIEDLDKAVK